MPAFSGKSRDNQMPVPLSRDVMVYVCHNCLSGDRRLPRQWKQDGAHIRVQEIPCSGKVDGQYLIRALENGVTGLCVVACPKGECTLAQGNCRAEIRIQTVQRLLAEIGLEPDRAQLLLRSPEESIELLEERIRSLVKRFCDYGESPLRQTSRLERSSA
jgi:coenzyme F420-reducing hydrogenase delta subunit